MKSRNSVFYVAMLFLLCMYSSGCGKKPEQKREELEFSVCTDTQLPDDLRQVIEEKKLHAFQLSYTTKEHLYIVVGYGEHDRMNLQVVVEELYKTERAIYIKTDLKTEEASASDGFFGDASMYPYIVIRVERLELPVFSVT